MDENQLAKRVKKITWDYKLIKPNDQCEFTFEEIRAKIYHKSYELMEQNNLKYEDKIKELEKKLVDAENKSKASTTQNTTRFTSSIVNRTSLRSCYNTTQGFSDDFTNVTCFSSNETKPFDVEDEEIDKERNKTILELSENDLTKKPLDDLTLNGTLFKPSQTTNADLNFTTNTMFLDNKTWLMTANTKEARLMAAKLMCTTLNGKTDDQTNIDDSEFTKDKTTSGSMFQTTMPTISIYKDNQSMSNSAKKEDQRNQYEPNSDTGSILVFEQQFTTQKPPLAAVEPANSKRKPLGIIEDNEIPSLQTTDTSLNDTTKIDFEPRAASTQYIKPLLNKLAQERHLDLDQTEMQSKDFLIDQHLKNNQNDDTRVNDKTFSNIMAQDFATNAWNSVKKDTNNKRVQSSETQAITKKLNLSWDNKDVHLHSQESQINITEFQFSQSIKFDLPSETALKTIPIMPNETIKDFTQSQPKKVEAAAAPTPSANINESNILTKSNLNATFNADYYKLCLGISNLTNITMSNISRLPEQSFSVENKQTEPKEQEPLLVKTNHKIEKEEEAKILTEKTNTIQFSNTITQLDKNEKTQANKQIDFDTKTINFTATNFLTTKTGINFSNSIIDSTFTDISEEHNTTTSSRLNETIAFAIRDPFSYEIKNRLLNRGALELLRKKKNFRNVTVDMPIIKEKTFILVNEISYKILEEVGNGAYARIYLIEDKDKKEKLALKVDKQATAWEFYISETLHERIKEQAFKVNVQDSFIRMNEFLNYKNGCMSTMSYYKNGTLLDLVNYHVQTNQNLPYFLVLYLTLELLYIIQYLHKCQIIHADIKPDNLLINKLPDSIDYFEPNRTKCLVLIDFNRSIDLRLLPDEAEFNAKTDNKSLLCCEMKSEKAWTYQIDYYGIMSCLHCIIFKKYMNTYNENDRFKITTAIPRSYDKLFAKLFDTFLNIPSCQEMPDVENEFIKGFVFLFKTELGASFSKHKQYLKDLNLNLILKKEKK